MESRLRLPAADSTNVADSRVTTGWALALMVNFTADTAEAAFDHHLTKPVDLDDVVRRLAAKTSVAGQRR
ncbi:hypothetical protein [Paraburkholderia hiiakae]|uniref:hypothetical protein n=1 Tax=Paraburkholderia hiiakae TaxID=1081782 RepID=UPI00191A8E4E|nr:hypothetical protein [Paraburkholderia hiiakae]